MSFVIHSYSIAKDIHVTLTIGILIEKDPELIRRLLGLIPFHGPSRPGDYMAVIQRITRVPYRPTTKQTQASSTGR
jgi:hypothetical protein